VNSITRLTASTSNAVSWLEAGRAMLYRSWQKDHTYRGFILVKNYSWTPHNTRGALFFDRGIKGVTEIAWDQAGQRHRWWPPSSSG